MLLQQKKLPDKQRYNKFLNRACREVAGFNELLHRFERNISILGRSQRTFESYGRHIAAMALHFGTLPTELDPEQVKDCLFLLQCQLTRYNTISKIMRCFSLSAN